MKIEKPTKRMTLREHLTHTEKCTRDLAEHFKESLVPTTAEFRDLSRPVRKRSGFPSRLAIQNMLAKMEQSGTEAMMLTGYVLEELKTIAETTKREIQSR
ncbi:MAG: hypothetical protein QM703_18795 [Gemmatales bacterium]